MWKKVKYSRRDILITIITILASLAIINQLRDQVYTTHLSRRFRLSRVQVGKDRIAERESQPEQPSKSDCSSAQGNNPKQQIESEKKIKSLLVLSWNQKTIGKPADEVWPELGPRGRPFEICYSRKLLDPKQYPCEYTNNRSMFLQSEALWFRGRTLPKTPLPLIHPPGQFWLFYEYEPPYKTWYTTNLTQYDKVFNLTSTYSRDSDVPFDNKLNCVRSKDKLDKLTGVDFMARKTRNVSVAWFATVCQTQSKREQYVKEMQKYIDVDVYGRCGNKVCGNNHPSTGEYKQCDEELLNGNGSYKFYLAFENSLCDDYVTEKFFKLLPMDIVPVVMGKYDYTRVIPKDSFIDVRDFVSPKALAEYLHSVIKDRELYNRFIRNKKSLSCSAGPGDMPNPCMLCKVHHDFRGKTKVVHSLERFWGSRRCIHPANLYAPGDSDFDLGKKIQWHNVSHDAT